MSAVVACDISTFALDFVKLDEDTNRAEWVRCELAGKNAWERTLAISDAMPRLSPVRNRMYGDHSNHWWDDVYLFAIEAPYGRGHAGATSLLNRVVGSVVASLPSNLRVPERCWIVAPHEWKSGLGLKGKPDDLDLLNLVGEGKPGCWADIGFVPAGQDARDAYCMAMWSRDTNARAVAAA